MVYNTIRATPLPRPTHRLASLTKLKELKLYDNHIASLEGLAALTSLHTLDVSGNRLTSLQASAAPGGGTRDRTGWAGQGMRRAVAAAPRTLAHLSPSVRSCSSPPSPCLPLGRCARLSIGASVHRRRNVGTHTSRRRCACARACAGAGAPPQPAGAALRLQPRARVARGAGQGQRHREPGRLALRAARPLVAQRSLLAHRAGAGRQPRRVAQGPAALRPAAGAAPGAQPAQQPAGAQGLRRHARRERVCVGGGRTCSRGVQAGMRSTSIYRPHWPRFPNVGVEAC